MLPGCSRTCHHDRSSTTSSERITVRSDRDGVDKSRPVVVGHHRAICEPFNRGRAAGHHEAAVNQCFLKFEIGSSTDLGVENNVRYLVDIRIRQFAKRPCPRLWALKEPIPEKGTLYYSWWYM